MSNFPKFMIGNIVKSPYGSLWIVTEIDDKYMRAVSFEYTNSSLGCSKETTKRGKHQCGCVDNYGEADPQCTNCEGSGEAVTVFAGYEEYEFVASTVKEFITSRMMRIFSL